MQDQAITESMGPIVDHSFEHPALSDQMITRTRCWPRVRCGIRAPCRRVSMRRRCMGGRAAVSA